MSTMTRHYTRDDRAESIYQYLVVEVPAGAGGLDVTLEYDRGETTLDLGLIGPDQFRGWSGSERSRRRRHRAVGDTRDTCPARSAGRGRSSSACTASRPAASTSPCTSRRPTSRPTAAAATAAAAAPGTPAAAPTSRLPPATSGWPATSTVTRSTPTARWRSSSWRRGLPARGLDLLAVTDHNTVSHHAHLGAAGDHAGILLVPGQEVTTDIGHANCFGAIGWIDFRDPPDVVAGRGDRARRPDVGQPPVGVGLRLADAAGRVRPTSSRCGTGRGIAATRWP